MKKKIAVLALRLTHVIIDLEEVSDHFCEVAMIHGDVDMDIIHVNLERKVTELWDILAIVDSNSRSVKKKLAG